MRGNVFVYWIQTIANDRHLTTTTTTSSTTTMTTNKCGYEKKKNSIFTGFPANDNMAQVKNCNEKKER
jgi:hypothetical protein